MAGSIAARPVEEAVRPPVAAARPALAIDDTPTRRCGSHARRST
jgi:hypothetical protein